MSVYTPVSSTELELFLERYAIGALRSYSGIENGITNTNFWLQTETGHFVLTLYEHHQPAALDYILGLQYHLAKQGVACATPVTDNSQRYYSTLNNRPAAIINQVGGDVCHRLKSRHCASIGSELAKFHLSGKSYGNTRVNPTGKLWRSKIQQLVSPLMEADERNLLQEELKAYQNLEMHNLPAGPAHCDLFHDNCLFENECLNGIIDFDYACDEAFVYDLAITQNDCCIYEDGSIDTILRDAFLTAYASIRPLQAIEQDMLAFMLRLAATRFWLSRLHDRHFPLVGEMTFTKDPDEFKNILLLRRENN